MNANSNNNFNNQNQNNNQISNNEILELAQLSCINLTGDEMETLSSYLGNILEHFAIIEGVNSNPEAIALPVERIASLDELRADEPSSWRKDNLHSSAPDYEETYYFVPKVL